MVSSTAGTDRTCANFVLRTAIQTCTFSILGDFARQLLHTSLSILPKLATEHSSQRCSSTRKLQLENKSNSAPPRAHQHCSTIDTQRTSLAATMSYKDITKITSADLIIGCLAGCLWCHVTSDLCIPGMLVFLKFYWYPGRKVCIF